MPLALTGHRVSRVVRGLPIAHGATHPTELSVGDALHQVGHGGHHVHRHAGPTLCQRRNLRSPAALLLRKLSGHIRTGHLILNGIPVQQRTHATGDTADDRTHRRADAWGEHRTHACTRDRATRRATQERERIGGILVPLVLLGIHLPVELTDAARRRARLRRILRVLLTTLLQAEPIGLLGSTHHHGAHDVVRGILAVGVVQILPLHATLEHIAKLDAGLFIIPEGDTVLLVPEPVQRVATLLQRLVVVLHEARQERRVPAVRHLIQVLPRGERRQGIP